MKQTIKYVQHRESTKRKRRLSHKRTRAPPNDKLDGLLFDSNKRRVETQLICIKRHISIGMNVVNQYSPDHKIGVGIPTPALTPELQEFRCRADDLLRCVLFNKPRVCVGHLRNDTDQLLYSLNHFAGQVMILPLSIECNKKDLRLMFTYGDKTSSIEGNQFNGKSSKILLNLCSDSAADAWLLSRKRYIGLFSREKIIGQWATSALTIVEGRLIFEMIFHEKSPNGPSVLIGRAKFQVDWFPKLKSQCSSVCNEDTGGSFCQRSIPQ